MKVFIYYAIILFLLLFSGIEGYALTIHVPADSSTIRKGISGASDGDTVLVSSGTYYELINFMGKAITLKSVSGRKATAIDGVHEGPIVSFNHGEDSTSVITGFTIQNGYTPSPEPGGAGIICVGTSPTIRTNTFQNNLTWGWDAQGCGILCIDNSSPLIVDNIFQDNLMKYHQEAGGGCGISCLNGSSPAILGNKFYNNMTKGGNGGAVYCGNNSSPWIKNNFILDNNIERYLGGGVCARYSSHPVIEENIIKNNLAGYGGGVYAGYYSDPTIISNIFVENRGYHHKSSGMGVYCEYYCEPVISGNIFKNLQAPLEGGAIYLHWFSIADISYNDFINNKAVHTGGAIMAWYFSDAKIVNNTFYGNTADSSGSAIGMYFSHPSIKNNIFANNQGKFVLYFDDKPQNDAFDTDIDEDYNLFWGNSDSLARGFDLGEHEIMGNPYFTYPDTGNFALLPGSHAIDSGDPSFQVPEGGGSRIDIGAHEYMFIDKGLKVEITGLNPEIHPNSIDTFTVKITRLGGTKINVDYWIDISGPFSRSLTRGSGILINPNMPYEDEVILKVVKNAPLGNYIIKPKAGIRGKEIWADAVANTVIIK